MAWYLQRPFQDAAQCRISRCHRECPLDTSGLQVGAALRAAGRQGSTAESCWRNRQRCKAAGKCARGAG